MTHQINRRLTRQFKRPLSFRQGSLRYTRHFKGTIKGRTRILTTNRRPHHQRRRKRFTRNQLLPRPIITTMGRIIIGPIRDITPLQIRNTMRVNQLNHSTKVRGAFTTQILSRRRIIRRHRRPFTRTTSTQVITKGTLNSLTLHHVNKRRPTLLRTNHTRFINRLTRRFTRRPIIKHKGNRTSPNHVRTRTTRFINKMKRNKVRVTRRTIGNVCKGLPSTRRTRSVISTRNIRMFNRLNRTYPPPNMTITYRTFPIMDQRSPILPSNQRYIKQDPNLQIRIRRI